MGKLGYDYTLRNELAHIIAQPESAKQRKRAQALLWVDNGATVTSVAKRLGTTRQSLYNWYESVQERTGPIRRRLDDAPRPGAPRKKSNPVDRVLPQLLSISPQRKGYRAKRWTRRLLQNYFLKTHQLDVSDSTLKRAIHRAHYKWVHNHYELDLFSTTDEQMLTPMG